jgi:hypothetical protein
MIISLAEVSKQRQGVGIRSELFAVFAAVIKKIIHG